VTGLVPWAYNSVTEQFFKSLSPAESQRISLNEYVRDKWTFHAKGFWYDFSGKETMTMVGSSNFGMEETRLAE